MEQMLVGWPGLRCAREHGVWLERKESWGPTSEEPLGSLGKAKLHGQGELIGSAILCMLLNL